MGSSTCFSSPPVLDLPSSSSTQNGSFSFGIQNRGGKGAEFHIDTSTSVDSLYERIHTPRYQNDATDSPLLAIAMALELCPYVSSCRHSIWNNNYITYIMSTLRNNVHTISCNRFDRSCIDTALAPVSIATLLVSTVVCWVPGHPNLVCLVNPQSPNILPSVPTLGL